MSSPMKLTSSASFSPSIRISLRLRIHQAQAKNFCRVLDIRVTEILHMQIPYGHAHIDGNLNFASHEVAAIHPAQVPYDVCDALKKKGFKLIECPSRLEAKETFGINFVAIKPGLIVMPAGNERLQELLEQNGIEVIAVELDEIMKGYGAIHCCTAFLKRESN